MTGTLIIPQIHERWIAWCRIGDRNSRDVARISAWKYGTNYSAAPLDAVFTDSGQRVWSLSVRGYGDSPDLAREDLELELVAIENAARSMPPVVVSRRFEGLGHRHALSRSDATFPEAETIALCGATARAVDPRRAKAWADQSTACPACQKIFAAIERGLKR